MHSYSRVKTYRVQPSNFHVKRTALIFAFQQFCLYKGGGELDAKKKSTEGSAASTQFLSI